MKADLDALEEMFVIHFTEAWMPTGLAVLAELKAAREVVKANQLLMSQGDVNFCGDVNVRIFDAICDALDAYDKATRGEETP